MYNSELNGTLMIRHSPTILFNLDTFRFNSLQLFDEGPLNCLSKRKVLLFSALKNIQFSSKELKSGDLGGNFIYL